MEGIKLGALQGAINAPLLTRAIGGAQGNAVAFKIHLEEGEFTRELCDAVEKAIDERLTAMFEENSEEAELTAEEVLEAYHENPEIREKLHEEIDVSDLVEEKELDLDDLFTRGEIKAHVSENFDPREMFDEDDILLAVKDCEPDGVAEALKWHPSACFTKVDLAKALLDYEDNATPEQAASTFRGTLRGDFPDKYIEAFVAHLWQLTFADNVPTPKLAPPAKPDVTNGKAELKAILAKLLMALE